MVTPDSTPSTFASTPAEPSIDKVGTEKEYYSACTGVAIADSNAPIIKGGRTALSDTIRKSATKLIRGAAVAPVGGISNIANLSDFTLATGTKLKGNTILFYDLSNVVDGVVTIDSLTPATGAKTIIVK